MLIQAFLSVPGIDFIPYQPVIVLCIFFNGPEAEGRQRFKSFLDIGI